MGCCFASSNSRGGKDGEEVEINFNQLHNKKGNKKGKVEEDEEICNMCQYGPMSANMKRDSANQVSGSGTLLGSCPLDCDTGRWEVEIVKGITNTKQIQIGIKRFYKHIPTEHLNQTLEQANNSANASNETIGYFLSDDKLTLKEGDIIGVYWDQTDLPMLQFTHNGNLLFSASVNRVRPSNDMYIAVSLDGQLTNNQGSFRILFDGKQFHHPSIANKFKMVICSTKLI